MARPGNHAGTNRHLASPSLPPQELSQGCEVGVNGRGIEVKAALELEQFSVARLQPWPQPGHGCRDVDTSHVHAVLDSDLPSAVGELHVVRAVGVEAENFSGLV